MTGPRSMRWWLPSGERFGRGFCAVRMTQLQDIAHGRLMLCIMHVTIGTDSCQHILPQYRHSSRTWSI